MSVLHIVNKSPLEKNSLDSCLRLARADSAILLIEDGIYAAQAGTVTAEKISRALDKHQIYALEPDLKARGIGTDKTIAGIIPIDYAGFVKLTTEYDKTQSWL